MVGALYSTSGGPGLSPGWGHCVVFLGKTLNWCAVPQFPPRCVIG